MREEYNRREEREGANHDKQRDEDISVVSEYVVSDAAQIDELSILIRTRTTHDMNKLSVPKYQPSSSNRELK